MIKELLLYFALLLWFVVPSEAQPTIFASQIEADENENVYIDVVAKNMDPIIGIQFAIEWDQDVLFFFFEEDFSLPSTGDNFNISDSGKLRFQWFGDAYTIEDEQVMFRLRFKVIGEPGSSSPINFVEDNTSSSTNFVIEVISSASQLMDVDFQSGLVDVNFPLSTDNAPSPSVATIYSNQPNPFQNYTLIPFEIVETQNIQLTIYDTVGRLVFQQAKQFTTGKNTWRIDNSLLPVSGTYLYRLKSEHFDYTQLMNYNR